MSSSRGTGRCDVFYHVPEDGDDERRPNLFTAASDGKEVRLCDVKKSFPIPGNYLFRFKKAFRRSYVWLDVLDELQPVPKFEGTIVAKVSRIRVPETASKLLLDSDEKVARPKSVIDHDDTCLLETSLTRKVSSSNDLLGLHCSNTQSQIDHHSSGGTPKANVSHSKIFTQSDWGEDTPSKTGVDNLADDFLGSPGSAHDIFNLDWTSEDTFASSSKGKLKAPMNGFEDNGIKKSDLNRLPKKSFPVSGESNLSMNLSTAAKNFRL